jgi:acyl-CoA reductase-like NAD-dependent aldehyde dehydrogenase
VAKKGPGLPWQPGVSVTPLPEPTKPKYLEDLIGDALAKGATLANEAGGGGALRGALFTPAVVDGVKPNMRLFTEEQFGPVVPVARYSEIGEVHTTLTLTPTLSLAPSLTLTLTLTLTLPLPLPLTLSKVHAALRDSWNGQQALFTL